VWCDIDFITPIIKQFIVASREISLPALRSGGGGATASSAEALLPSIMAYAAKFGLSTLNGIVVIALCLEMRMRMIMNSFGKSEDIILTSLLANSYRPSHCISLCCVCRLRSFTVMHRWSIGLIVNRALQSLWLWLWLDIRTSQNSRTTMICDKSSRNSYLGPPQSYYSLLMSNVARDMGIVTDLKSQRQWQNNPKTSPIPPYRAIQYYCLLMHDFKLLD